jgi:hypothetical protein
MRNLLRTLAVLWLTTLLSLPAQADQTVITSIMAPEVESILRDLGFTGTRIDEDDDVIVMMHGRSVLVVIGSGNGRQLRASVAFVGVDLGLEEVNAWNRERILSKAYLDKDGDTILEAEVDLDGGVTVDRVKDWLHTFSFTIDLFVREVIQGETMDTPAPRRSRGDLSAGLPGGLQGIG